MTPDVTPAEAKALGLTDVADYLWPTEQGPLFEEIQRLKTLGIDPRTSRHTVEGAQYLRLWSRPAGARLDAKIEFRHKVKSKCSKAHTQARKTNQRTA